MQFKKVKLVKELAEELLVKFLVDCWGNCLSNFIKTLGDLWKTKKLECF